MKVETEQISLTDKLIETRNNERTVNIVYRGVLETTTWPAIHQLRTTGQMCISKVPVSSSMDAMG